MLNGLAGPDARHQGLSARRAATAKQGTEGRKSRQALIRQIVDEHNFTIRQLYQWVATERGHYTSSAVPRKSPTNSRKWFTSEAAVDFNHPTALAARRTR
ncbi:hypothetical protein [Mesorhizobium sp.]|uniref:hypothetical protein n=1 Tax=Mesorhizobium sp. TaxID=1871066 RepID=UPI00257D27E8|nr:hypothetical protein [Mesorhizobium sp.]